MNSPREAASATVWGRHRAVLLSAALLIGLALAILIRLPLLDFKSLDFYNSRVQVYPQLQQQGFGILASSGSNYNPAYFYLLYVIARVLPALPITAAVKLPAIVMDFVCALFVYLIVRLKYAKGPAPACSGLLVLFAPTVVTNSAFWGQTDSMHTAGILACIYFLLRRQHLWAILAFAFALVFKLQAIFLAPLLLALFLRGELSWKPFLLVPAVLFVALVPVWIAGRPLAGLLTMYLNQTAAYEAVTMNAPSVYAWVPDTKQMFDVLYRPGLMLAAAAAFLLTAAMYKAPRKLTSPLLLEMALLTVLVMPFFLPKMHERYFYPADVISIAFALYFPRFFFVPLAVIGVSSFSYFPFLFNVEIVPLPILAFVLLAVICVLAYHTLRQLYAPNGGAVGADDLGSVEGGLADVPGRVGGIS